jgi:hypothetical protein
MKLEGKDQVEVVLETLSDSTPAEEAMSRKESIKSRGIQAEKQCIAMETKSNKRHPKERTH